MESTFVLCPLCGGKTRLKLLTCTVLRNYPLFCPKCRQEILIHAEEGRISVIQYFHSEEGVK